MNPLEKTAALALRPYMSKDPVIFDVGSNKGDWAAILGPSCGEVYLFEPNLVLLHYSMVRFDGFDNFRYHNFGLYSSDEERDFYYFTNSNSGLSSVYYNQLWVDMGLPMKRGKTQVRTLDGFWDKEIDFLKIDVEGADFEVLKGAENLLKSKLIKFIQVEHSDHIMLSGHTWEELVTFVRSVGYDVYDFDGEKFIKATEFTQENYYLMEEFTQDWNREFKENTKGIKVDFALEIGCFEGLTTCYICDHLLNPGGRVIAIDPLPDDYNVLPFGEDNKIFEGQYERFLRNTRTRPVELLRMESYKAFKSTGFNDYRFDLIYIDGDHRTDAVFSDGLNAMKVCKKGGIIIFDDYEWREETKLGIDRFLSDQSHRIEILHKGYQIVVKKIRNLDE